MATIKALAVKREPLVGDVAVFHYNNGLDHVALVTEAGTSSVDITEANYVHAEFTRRTVPLDHYSLRGFVTIASPEIPLSK